MQDKHEEVTLGFFWNLVKPFKLHISVIVIVGIIWSVFTVVKAYLFKLIIDTLSSGAGSAFWPITLYIGSWIMTEWFMRIRDFAVMYFKPYLKKHVITVFTKQMMHYDDHYFQENTPGALINGLRNLYDGVDDGIYILEELFSHCILIISALISMYIINAYFSLIAVGWFVLWAVLAYTWAKNGHILAFLINAVRTRLSFHLGDVFSNTSTIKTFNSIEHENMITEKIADEVARIEFSREKMFFKIWVVQGVLFFCTSFLVFFVLLSKYKAGEVTIGDFAMMIELLQTIYLYLFDFAKDVSEFSEVTGKVLQGMDVVYRNINEHIEMKSSLNIKNGEIVFEKVHYKYPGEEENAFESNKTIKIAGGSTVALIGPSGGGKTTLVKLLLRLAEPSAGRILIDGEDIAQYDVNSVRSIFALVPQELGIFNRTIKENIKYGSFNATDAEMIAAAKKAQIDDVIQELPAGYDTKFGTEIMLSGGQKQRLMIARGLLRKAKIFVFDEPTSALDARTEFDVLANIRETTKGCTKIIIAHRLNTIKYADLILVCDEGEIVEQGTHEQLMEKRGLYFEMMNLV